MGKQLIFRPVHHLSVDQHVSVSLPEPGTELVAAVVRITSDEIWLQFSRPLQQSPFQEGERVRTKYWNDVAIYYFDAEILKIWGTEATNVSIAAPRVGVLLERRISFRIDSPVAFSFTVVHASNLDLVGEKIRHAKTEDLSVGGLKFESNLPFVSGDQLEVNLHLPESQSVQAAGWVVRCETVQRTGRSVREVGVRFVHLNAEDQKRLLRFLSAHQKPPGQ